MLKYKYWIALERSKGISTAGLKEIYTTINPLGISISDLFDLNEEELRKEFNFRENITAAVLQAQSLVESIEEEYCDMIEAKIQPILFFEETYPKEILEKLDNQAPPILYTANKISILHGDRAAIIGGTDPSPKGEMISYLSAKEISKHNIIVVTGLTKGIGTAAARGAMEGGGRTVAVLPGGMFTFAMSERLLEVYDPERFLLLSPFYPSEGVTEYNAILRNRIITVLSKALFIVETEENGIPIEAAKNAQKLNIPIFTAEYSEYPSSASGNKLLMKEYAAIPLRGKKENNSIKPNIDMLLAKIKFNH